MRATVFSVPNNFSFKTLDIVGGFCYTFFENILVSGKHKMKRIKNIKEKIIITAVILIFVAVLYALRAPCPIYYFTKIECFGCGMTRALVAALKFQFAIAFSYHAMFWSVPILYLAFLLDGKIFKKRWLNITLFALIGIGFIVNKIV